MNVLIYLDQNTLSDLRDRKLQESENEHLKLLKDVLNLEKVSVVYSHITLNESFRLKILNIQRAYSTFDRFERTIHQSIASHIKSSYARFDMV